MNNSTIVNPNETGNKIYQFLTFKLGKESFGLPVEKVREVVEYCKVYPIPRVPKYIKGVINLRGEVLPVIDLPYLFYGKNAVLDSSTSIVFVEIMYNDELIVLGALIDAVEAVLDIGEDNIEPPPSFGENIKAEYIRNIGKIESKFIIILNMESVFNLNALSIFTQENNINKPAGGLK